MQAVRAELFRVKGKNLINDQKHQEVEMKLHTREPPVGVEANERIKFCIVDDEVKETRAPENFLLTQTKETPEPSTASSLFATSNQCPCRTLTGEPIVHKALLRIVIRMEDNLQARQDLLQEALVFFWSKERQYPRQRLSWYLQGVKFFLQNLSSSGRSLDSPKHREAQAPLGDNCDRPDESLDPFESADGIMSEINARDIRSLLIELLEPIDQTILDGLEEGWAGRAIAKRLHISHESVRRHRIKIAAAALKLGIVPLMPSPDQSNPPL